VFISAIPSIAIVEPRFGLSSLILRQAAIARSSGSFARPGSAAVKWMFPSACASLPAMSSVNSSCARSDSPVFTQSSDSCAFDESNAPTNAIVDAAIAAVR
jgi:hypothetical protein